MKFFDPCLEPLTKRHEATVDYGGRSGNKLYFSSGISLAVTLPWLESTILVAFLVNEANILGRNTLNDHSKEKMLHEPSQESSVPCP